MAVKQDCGVSWTFVTDVAVRHILAAADVLWPGASVQLIARVPSVTSYVHLVRVNGRDLYAKYSFLGKSLVSVLRGAHGDQARVRAEQQRYLTRANGVVEREAQQLRRLAETDLLRVCEFAGCANGVMFTEAVTAGVPLDEMLLINPGHAAALLRQAWEPVTRLHSISSDGWPMMRERNIGATFARKFPHPSQPLDDTSSATAELVDRVWFAAMSMRDLPGPSADSVLIFGELKPEHVIMTSTGPIFIDPGVHLATSAAELAKLISRCILLLLTGQAGRYAKQQVLAGICELISQEHDGNRFCPADAWLADLVTTLVRDMINIVSTRLSLTTTAMSHVATGAVDPHAVVVSVIERAARRLARRGHPMDVWDLLVTEVLSA